MSYHYTPYDPTIWLIFAAFFVCVFLIIKIYHRIYPNYPESIERDEDLEHTAGTHARTEIDPSD